MKSCPTALKVNVERYEAHSIASASDIPLSSNRPEREYALKLIKINYQIHHCNIKEFLNK